ncbi:flagellar export chaperone FlgN [Paenarthrobacter sp. NPDC089989]|uniref:flagellar export chaperone FlgN n=1 Tax=unclassified Paenarthrobacter TaxID=2634190 RepID=UPI0038021C95
MGADELSATLWRERRQLDFLLFLLETQLLHLRAGSWHRLNITAAELEKVLEKLRFESLARSVEASSAAAEWKAPDKSTLPALVAIAPPGVWAELLDEHRRAMISLVESIDGVANANVAALSEGPPFDARQDSDIEALAQQANIQRALDAVKSTSLRSLRDFLGLD